MVESENEPEYVTKMRKTLERGHSMASNAAHAALRMVERQRDVAVRAKEAVTIEYENLLRKQEDKVHNMGEAVLKRVQELGYQIEPDDNIRARLPQLTSKVKTWAKQYGSLGAAKNLPNSVQSQLMGMLSQALSPSTSKSGFAQALEQGISTTLLLNAVFAKAIFDHLVRTEFFFLEGMIGRRSKADLSQALMDLQGLGLEGMLHSRSSTF